jgi:hypothetical protein
LRDLYKSPVEKDYVKRSVAASGKLIRTAVLNGTVTHRRMHGSQETGLCKVKKETKDSPLGLICLL